MQFITDQFPLLQKQSQELEEKNTSLLKWTQSFPSTSEQYMQLDTERRLSTAIRLFWAYACLRGYKTAAEVAVTVDHATEKEGQIVTSRLNICEGDDFSDNPANIRIDFSMRDDSTNTVSQTHRGIKINCYPTYSNGETSWTTSLEQPLTQNADSKRQPRSRDNLHGMDPEVLIQIIDESAVVLLEKYIVPRYTIFSKMGALAFR